MELIFHVFTVCICVNVFGQIKKNEMGGTCSTYGGWERCIKVFGGQTKGKETTWKAQASMKDSIKMDLKEVGWGHGLDRFGSG
jgi:hypothetical protein